jgi:hypothetical protein
MTKHTAKTFPINDVSNVLFQAARELAGGLGVWRLFEAETGGSK